MFLNVLEFRLMFFVSTLITMRVTDTLRYLREPEQKMIGPSSTFLLAVAVGSRSACQKVIDKVIPMLLQQFNVLRQVGRRTI